MPKSARDVRGRGFSCVKRDEEPLRFARGGKYRTGGLLSEAVLLFSIWCPEAWLAASCLMQGSTARPEGVFGASRADPVRKEGPLSEQAGRRPEAVSGFRWYPNA
ncbi:hypothetical protein Taro_053816 [Colocasia esculenta]|uniref:Uncharacterized protein n=1 Tax=Colocasia esculenta TaxID=4460 RepID=A0A843XM83_COLES|nr:hypothetical protein [Colocasia esculenta]